MKTIISVLLLLAIPQAEQMVTPKVEQKQSQHTVTDTWQVRTCPDGYEGHYVIEAPGFDVNYTVNYLAGPYIGGTLAFTVCFKKEYIEKLRKDPQMQSTIPLPPRGV